MEAMGSTAAGIVIEAITATLEHRESGASHQKVAPELVIRESTQARK
jgi:DNA-binding LacI/PurR family transcriptional regulator